MCKVAIINNPMECYLKRQLEYFEITKYKYSYSSALNPYKLNKTWVYVATLDIIKTQGYC